jgi:dolichyl-phosphate beta-glucosyltransferase
VIVADDGSSDATVDYVQGVTQTWPQLTIVALERNQGKGAAVRAGMLRARGDTRLFTDADLSTPIEELPRLRTRLGGACQVAIASRAVPGSTIDVHQPGRREMMGRTYNRLLQLVALPGLHDTQCGFKVFTAEAAVTCFQPLRTKGFGFDAEVLLRARRHGWEIAEVPVRWSHRDDSRVSALRDSGMVLFDLVRLRFRRR